MKKTFTLTWWRCLGAAILLLSSAGLTSAQSSLNTFDLVSNGGALVNDGPSGHAAFKAAQAFINRHDGNTTLTIPAGTYIVGLQDPTAGPYHGENILDLSNVHDVDIVGLGNVVIKFKDHLKFGRDPNYTSNQITWSPGYFMSFFRCRNIVIRNLHIDGNSANFDFMNIAANHNMELEHDGIFLEDTHDVTVEDVTVEHMGRDGIQAKCPELSPGQIGPLSLVMNNCHFDDNGRDGFSWVGGYGVDATNCTFNRSGRGEVHAGLKAGIDLEPEVGNVEHGRFTNCQFVNNLRIGVETGLVPGAGDDFIFANCTISGGGAGGPAIIAYFPNIRFTNCDIYGGLQNAYNAQYAQDEARAMRFTDCRFTDAPLNGFQTMAEFGTLIKVYQTASRARFERCEFTTHTFKHSFMHIDKAGASIQENLRFIDSRFVTAYTDALSPNNREPVFATHVSFEGNCIFTKENNNPPPVPAGEGPIIYRLRPPVVQGTLTLAGGPDIQYIADADVFTVKAGSVLNINDHNELQIYSGSPSGALRIEEGATVIVNQGGALTTSGPPPIYIDGTLIVRSGGYICFANGNMVVFGPHGRVQYDPGTIFGCPPNHTTINCEGTLRPYPMSNPTPFSVWLAQPFFHTDPDAVDQVFVSTDAVVSGTGALWSSHANYPSIGNTYAWQVDYGQGYVPVTSNYPGSLVLTYNVNAPMRPVRIALTVTDNHAQAFGETTVIYPAMRSDSGSLSLYPNPADASIEVQRPTAQQKDRTLVPSALAEVQVYTSTGTRLYTAEMAANQLHLDTSRWPTGLYLVRIVEGKQVTTRQLRVVH
jgi:hypothetical protein